MTTSLRVYEWKFLVFFQYRDKSCDHKHCDGGDIVFLICHGPLVSICLKGYLNLWVEAHHDESPPCHVW